jgi:hypothetical protein
MLRGQVGVDPQHPEERGNPAPMVRGVAVEPIPKGHRVPAGPVDAEQQQSKPQPTVLGLDAGQRAAQSVHGQGGYPLRRGRHQPRDQFGRRVEGRVNGSGRWGQRTVTQAEVGRQVDRPQRRGAGVVAPAAVVGPVLVQEVQVSETGEAPDAAPVRAHVVDGYAAAQPHAVLGEEGAVAASAPRPDGARWARGGASAGGQRLPAGRRGRRAPAPRTWPHAVMGGGGGTTRSPLGGARRTGVAMRVWMTPA